MKSEKERRESGRSAKQLLSSSMPNRKPFARSFHKRQSRRVRRERAELNTQSRMKVAREMAHAPRLRATIGWPNRTTTCSEAQTKRATEVPKGTMLRKVTKAEETRRGRSAARRTNETRRARRTRNPGRSPADIARTSALSRRVSCTVMSRRRRQLVKTQEPGLRRAQRKIR